MFQKTTFQLLPAALLLTAGAAAQTNENFTQSYPLDPQGRIELKNICGDVRIQAWNRNEVLIEAVKTAETAEQLAEAEISVDSDSGSIRIETIYPRGMRSFSCGGDDDGWRFRSRDRSPVVATVDYTLSVPFGAEVDDVNLVNGALDVSGLEGDVKASTVNGSVKAANLGGRARLSSVNGNVEAERLDGMVELSTVNGRVEFRLDESGIERRVKLSSVNGEVVLRMPSGGQAEIEASTVHGKIRNEFGLKVDNSGMVGSRLSARLGAVGPRVHLSTVNGSVDIVK